MIIDGFDVPNNQVLPRKAEDIDNQMETALSTFSPYTFLAAMALPNFVKATQTMARNQTLANEAFIACGLERYRLAHGQYPETLEALVPQFAEKLPHDIIGGQPLKYHRTADGQFVLYSVGWNEKDDGGVPGKTVDGGRLGLAVGGGKPSRGRSTVLGCSWAFSTPCPGLRDAALRPWDAQLAGAIPLYRPARETICRQPCQYLQRTHRRLLKAVICIAVVGLLLVAGWVWLDHSRRAGSASSDEAAPPRFATHARVPRLPAPRMPARASPIEAQPAEPPPTNLLAHLLKDGQELRLSPKQLDAYLGRNGRSAESLLAAYRLTGDAGFLREAEEKSPEDPRVAYVALFTSESPETRRQWLDSFKQSAPDNALANYLSALDHFKAGQTDEAVQDLMDAAGKAKFHEYGMTCPERRGGLSERRVFGG